MRKVLGVITVLILILCSLVGCRDLGRTSVPNERNFISAVGFDLEEGEWAFSLRIAGGSEETGEILFSKGETLWAAFEGLVAGSVGELQFTHCRAIILGESVTEDALNTAVRFCADKLKIPLSARMISADNASDILSAVEGGNGYEISDIADKTAKELGFGAHSALYETETARMQRVSLFALPRFIVDGKLQMTGLTVYKDDTPTAHLSIAESRVYAVMRNVFEGGEISRGGKSEKLRSASSKINCSLSGDVLNIEIVLCSNSESRLLTDEVKSVLSKYDTDLFGIELQIESKNPEIYEKIKPHFEEYYKNARFWVREEK